MRVAIKKGLGFGITSGIITTLGLIIGLSSSENSVKIIISGILIIAIADAMSDALGIHVSVEGEHSSTSKQIWAATISTFLSKLVIASSFIIPFLFLDKIIAIYISIIWGILLISGFTYYISKSKNINPFHPIFEHLGIMALVIICTYYVGIGVNLIF